MKNKKYKILKINQKGGDENILIKKLKKINLPKNQLIFYILKKNDIQYILIGENHYMLDVQYRKEIYQDIHNYCINNNTHLFIEDETKEYEEDAKLYENYLNQINETVEKEKMKFSVLGKLSNDDDILNKTYFDIRSSIVPLLNKNDYVQNIFIIIQIILTKIVETKMNGSEEQQIFMSNTFLQFIDERFLKPQIIYLLKNKKTYTSNKQVEKIYNKLLYKSLYDEFKVIIDEISSLDNFDDIDKIMNNVEKLIVAYQVNDLFIMNKIVNNNDKNNLIYGGLSHIINLHEFLINNGFNES